MGRPRKSPKDKRVACTFSLSPTLLKKIERATLVEFQSNRSRAIELLIKRGLMYLKEG